MRKDVVVRNRSRYKVHNRYSYLNNFHLCWPKRWNGVNFLKVISFTINQTYSLMWHQWRIIIKLRTSDKLRVQNCTNSLFLGLLWVIQWTRGPGIKGLPMEAGGLGTGKGFFPSEQIWTSPYVVTWGPHLWTDIIFFSVRQTTASVRRLLIFAHSIHYLM